MLNYNSWWCSCSRDRTGTKSDIFSPFVPPDTLFVHQNNAKREVDELWIWGGHFSRWRHFNWRHFWGVRRGSSLSSVAANMSPANIWKLVTTFGDISKDVRQGGGEGGGVLPNQMYGDITLNNSKSIVKTSQGRRRSREKLRSLHSCQSICFDSPNDVIFSDVDPAPLHKWKLCIKWPSLQTSRGF